MNIQNNNNQPLSSRSTAFHRVRWGSVIVAIIVVAGAYALVNSAGIIFYFLYYLFN